MLVAQEVIWGPEVLVRCRLAVLEHIICHQEARIKWDLVVQIRWFLAVKLRWVRALWGLLVQEDKWGTMDLRKWALMVLDK